LGSLDRQVAGTVTGSQPIFSPPARERNPGFFPVILTLICVRQHTVKHR